MSELEILDPTAERDAVHWSLAPALAREQSARVGLLDISKPKGDVFLDALETRLIAAGHEVRRYRKVTMARPAVRELVAEMIAACDAAVVALAD